MERALDFSGDIFAVVLDTSISNHEKIEELEGAIIVRFYTLTRSS